jgi:hypothetical protein
MHDPVSAFSIVFPNFDSQIQQREDPNSPSSVSILNPLLLKFSDIENLSKENEKHGDIHNSFQDLP